MHIGAVEGTAVPYRKKRGGERIFLMLHHCSAEGRRGLPIKTEIALQPLVMRCKAAFLPHALGGTRVLDAFSRCAAGSAR